MSLPILTPEAQRFLKTIGGAITHTMQTYKGEVLEMHRETLCYNLGISTNEPYCIESTGNGFKYICKYFEFEYSHHRFHEKKSIIFRELTGTS